MAGIPALTLHRSKNWNSEMAHTANVRPVAGQFGQAPFFTRLLAAVLAWNDTRVTRKELSRLTNHELDDIGLCIADIEAVARRRFR